MVSALVTPALGAPGGRTQIAPCSARVHKGVLPVWMRAGFSPSTRITYEVGKAGAIGAVLWNKPLNAPPAQHENNKILWVPRHLAKTVAPLWIRMQKMDGTKLVGAPVHRIVKTGPGPSLVDAPSAGCWRLTLTWSGQRDMLDVSYVPPTD
jgi:hypothetical protein